MKKLLSIAGVSLLAVTASAQAADLDYEREMGLIVSGVVDKWVGVQFISLDKSYSCPSSTSCQPAPDYFNDPTVLSNGGEGLLSLPLGPNFSIQNDFKYEVNDQAFDPASSSVGPRYWWQGAGHLSWRDPARGLFGIVGGVGGASNGWPVVGRQDYNFVGGEAQFYHDNITFYGQGGIVNMDMRGGFSGLGYDDGIFGRGAVRWFPTRESRLQVEATYLHLSSDLVDVDDETDVWSWKARYDVNLHNLPIIGSLPVFLAYRGTLRENCDRNDDFGSTGSGDLVDHTIMIGTSYSFSGDRVTIDRQGATLDTPDLGNMIGCTIGLAGSDRRLKTDIAELDTIENGIKLYSWKYKSDPVTTWVGVMAQDLVETHPEALVVGTDGYYRVRYDKLGVQMMTLEQWNTRHL